METQFERIERLWGEKQALLEALGCLISALDSILSDEDKRIPEFKVAESLLKTLSSRHLKRVGEIMPGLIHD